MSAVKFICPCCGHQAKYTEEFAKTIYGLVCTFFSVDPAVTMHSRCADTSTTTKARYFTAYFLRQMTGEKVFTISRFFSSQNFSSMAGQYCAYVEKKLARDKEWRMNHDDLKQYILAELSMTDEKINLGLPNIRNTFRK